MIITIIGPTINRSDASPKSIVYTAVIELFKKWNSVQMTDLLQFANECNEFLPVIIRVLKLVDICWHSFGESDDPRDLRLNTEQQKSLKKLVEMVNYTRHHTCTSYAFRIQLDTNLWTAGALSLTQSNSALEFMTAVSSFQFELPGVMSGRCGTNWRNGVVPVQKLRRLGCLIHC